MIVVRPVPLDIIFRLRRAILREGLPVEAAAFPADDDATTVHFGAFEGERVVGCATVHLDDWDARPAWRLRGMAVDPQAQRGGIGRRVLAAVDRHVAAHPPHFLWCNARLPAVGFYERCGWRAVGEIFDIPTAGPHRKMVKGA